MFVYFSNYRHSFNLFSDLLDRLHEEQKISERTYSILDTINWKIANALTWLWNKTQIELILFSKHDCWSLDYRLGKIIYKGLLKYKKENTMSIPQVDNEDVSDDLFIEGDDMFNADHELLEERWYYVLDQIIEAFDIIQKDDIPKKNEQAILDKGLYLFGKYFRNFWI